MTDYFNGCRLTFGVYYLLIFLVSMFLISHQLLEGYPSDTTFHMRSVEQLFDGTLFVPYPLWHICVHYMSYVTINDKMAASLVTAIFITLWAYIIHGVLHYLLGEAHEDRVSTFKILSLVSVIFVIGPIYLPFFNEKIYFGQGSPNVWHNVTLFTVKPFALLTFFFTILVLKNNNIRNYFILSIIFLTLSMFAKPSFALVFIPALLVYYISRRKYTNITFIFVCTMLAIFMSIAYFQYLNMFGENQTKIIIDFLGVWSQFSPNVLISILLGLGFPSAFLMLNFRISMEDDWIYLAWLMTVISIILYAFLAEEGERYGHGNFGWSYLVSMSILYIFTIAKFAEIMSSLGRFKVLTLNSILLYQVGVGIFYLSKILNGRGYA